MVDMMKTKARLRESTRTVASNTGHDRNAVISYHCSQKAKVMPITAF